MDILDYLQNEKIESIAVIGIAKNSGKTVFLNRLLSTAKDRGISTGLMSMGFDGERIDSVFGMEKPPVKVYPGFYLVSAANCLIQSTARFEIIESLDINTPLGETYLVRIIEEGEVLLAGPRSRKEIFQAKEVLNRHVQLVLVDGALNRKSSAAPDLTDGTFLAVGAAAAPKLKAVKEKAAGVITSMQLPVVTGEHEKLARKLIKEGKNGIIIREDQKLKTRSISAATGLHLTRELDSLRDESITGVVLSGALTESLLNYFRGKDYFKKNGSIIVSDPTKVFLKLRSLKRLLVEGPELLLLNPVNLLGIVTNAYSPGGGFFDPEVLAREIKELVPSLLVVDVVANIFLP